METVVKTKDVLARVKVGRTTLWKLERDGTFPKRRQIAPGITGWLSSEVDEWLTGRPRVDAQDAAVTTSDSIL